VSVRGPSTQRGRVTPAGAGIEVRPVRSRRERSAFIRLPWQLYRGSAHWVPPLISERKRPYPHIWDTVLRRGIKRAETGWILEINEPMNRAMEALTGRIVKRYRLYERLLEEDAPPAAQGASAG
jgi:hypothetical protein